MEVEKALRIINKGDPVEASDLIRSLEQVTKNPNQLNSTDVLRLYLLLLDRLFSEEVTKGGNDAATTSSGSQTPGNASTSTTSAPQNVWIKGSLGGWLRTFIQQNVSSSNSLSSATTSLLASADNAKNASMSNFSTLMQRPVAPSTGSSTSTSSANSSAALPVGVKLIQQLFMTSPLIRLVDEYQTHLQWNVNFLPHKLAALLTNRPSALVIEDYAAHILVQEFHRSLRATPTVRCLLLLLLCWLAASFSRLLTVVLCVCGVRAVCCDVVGLDDRIERVSILPLCIGTVCDDVLAIYEQTSSNGEQWWLYSTGIAQ